MLFSILTLLSALSISVIAAYFSIIGLATIFPGSIEAVIAMGAALEVGKIIASIWLHKNWKSAPKMIKFYLFSAIIVLMGITSMGIFGFLSKSHIEHEQTAEKSKALLEQVENKITRQRDYIQRQKDLITKKEEKFENLGGKTSENIKLEQEKISQLTNQLDRDISIDNEILKSLNNKLSILDKELNDLKNKSGSLFSSKKKDIEAKILEQKSERENIAKKIKIAEDNISKQRAETSEIISSIRKRIQEYQSLGFENPEQSESKTEMLNSNISNALDEIDKLEQEKFNYGDSTRQLEAEVGPIKYVAEFISDLTGSSFDIGKAVRIVILILIFVFDPLAILLVLAAHISLSKKFPKALEDESIIFEKIAQIESQNKQIEQKETEVGERKKDLEQELKIIELQECQSKKYKQEISENKDILRKIKLDTQKELLKQEDTTLISEELQELIKQKKSAKKEIKEIQIQKGKMLSRAEETIQSAREIKKVFGDHQENKEKIQKLKSEVYVSSKMFNELKSEIEVLEAEIQILQSSNKDLQAEKNSSKVTVDKLLKDNKMLLNQKDQLKDKSENLESENNKLKNAPTIDPNIKLQDKINNLINQKNRLLKENLELKDEKLLSIQIHSLDKKNFELKVPSKISGYHVYSKEEDYTQEQIHMLTQLSVDIDKECQERNQDKLQSIFNKKITSLVDPKMNNRDYRKHRPNYIFST
jgi:hypothetical protein